MYFFVLQIVNYGIAGHYEPHYDFARVRNISTASLNFIKKKYREGAFLNCQNNSMQGHLELKFVFIV